MPAALRDAARLGLEAASLDLGLAGLELRWFEPNGRETAFACECSPRTVWLAADPERDYWDVVRSTLHEAKHLAQFATLGPLGDALDRHDRETAAEGYAAATARLVKAFPRGAWRRLLGAYAGATPAEGGAR